MPKFLAVLAGTPLSDKKPPDALPRALAEGLKLHGAELDNVRACGGGTRWGRSEGSSHNLVKCAEVRNVTVANGF